MLIKNEYIDKWKKILFWNWFNHKWIFKKNNISENNIVVEINKEIITKNLWEKYKLNNNDKVEIITAVGGG